MKHIKLLIISLLIGVLLFSLLSCEENSVDNAWEKLEKTRNDFNLTADYDNSSLGSKPQNQDGEENPWCLSSSFMLQDDEPWEVLTDRNQRSWYVYEPIQIRKLSDNTYRISNFSTYSFENVKIWVKLKDKYCLLHDFKTLPALMRNDYQLPFSGDQTIAWLKIREANGSISNGYVDKDVIKAETVENGKIATPSFLIETQDPIYKKMTSIEAKWLLCYGKYSSGGKFKAITPSTAKKWMQTATNMAYTYSDKRFFATCNFDIYPYIGNTFQITKDDDGNITNMGVRQFHVNGTSLFTSQAHYDSLISGRINKSRRLDLGLVSGQGNVLGLGGGTTMTAIEWALSNAGNYIITHEFGHVCGYAHGSSYCYGEFGDSYIPQLQAMLYELGELPYGKTSNKGRRSLVQEFFYRFGDLMVQNGYLTNDQYKYLASKGDFVFSSNADWNRQCLEGMYSLWGLQKNSQGAWEVNPNSQLVINLKNQLNKYK